MTSYDNRTSETNELGQVSTFAVNALRQMTNSFDPLGRVTYYEYSPGSGGGC